MLSARHACHRRLRPQFHHVYMQVFISTSATRAMVSAESSQTRQGTYPEVAISPELHTSPAFLRKRTLTLSGSDDGVMNNLLPVLNIRPTRFRIYRFVNAFSNHYLFIMTKINLSA